MAARKWYLMVSRSGFSRAEICLAVSYLQSISQIIFFMTCTELFGTISEIVRRKRRMFAGSTKILKFSARFDEFLYSTDFKEPSSSGISLLASIVVLMSTQKFDRRRCAQ